LYELRISGDAPAGVIIDEAVELAKLFGSEAAPKFVNGVLATAVGGRSGSAELRASAPSPTLARGRGRSRRAWKLRQGGLRSWRTRRCTSASRRSSSSSSAST